MALEEPNLGGRPPIYPDTQENHDLVDKKCEEYFEYIKGETKEDEFEVSPDKFETRTAIVRKPEPPTVTGLALFLGFESKDTFYAYAKKDGFSYSLKKSLMRIEQHHEIQVAYGDKCTGNIFALKNFGWKDTQAIDHTTGGDKISMLPSLTTEELERRAKAVKELNDKS